MKRLITGLMAIILTLSLVGCGSAVNYVEEYKIIGVWKSAMDEDVYVRIMEDGTLSFEAVLTSSMTRTINGVTSTSTSKRISTQSGTWELQGKNFMFNKLAPYEMTFDGTEYKLVGEKTTYVRVGDLDYQVNLDTSVDSPEITKDPTPYIVGETLVAEGVEIKFTECGFYDDIKYSSRSSGIKITSGPSSDSNKQFFCMKGTLKNTGKGTVFPAIGGRVTLDDYEYDLEVEIIETSGTPCSTVDPLDTVVLMIYAHIPKELTKSFESGEMIFGFNDNFDNVDITNCTYLYSVQAKR